MKETPAAAIAAEERAALLLAVRRAGVRDISVMRAFEAVPREAFAPFRFRDLANNNMSLPLGCGQTMSRPSDLARRIEALRVAREHRVLEVGAGSGYGSAILARLAREVVTLERFETLSIEATRRLAGLGVDNVLVEVDAQEVPILDGSALPFVDLVRSAGLAEQGAVPRYVGARLGTVKGDDGSAFEVSVTFEAMPSVLFDAAIVLGKRAAVTELANLGHALEFLKDQYRHCKPILALGEAAALLETAGVPLALSSGEPDPGLLIAKDLDAATILPALVAAIGRHRHYEREMDPPEV